MLEARLELAAHRGGERFQLRQHARLCVLPPVAFGQVNLSDLRYFIDTRGPEMNTAIGEALSAAAAAEAGDRSRATYGFNKARDIALKGEAFSYPVGDYGSLLRDVAARPRWRRRTASRISSRRS